MFFVALLKRQEIGNVDISPKTIFSYPVYKLNQMTQHRERMLQDGALLCSKGIIKGDMSNFRLISDKNLFYQLFVHNLVKNT